MPSVQHWKDFRENGGRCLCWSTAQGAFFLTSSFLFRFSTWASHLKFPLYILYIVVRNKEWAHILWPFSGKKNLKRGPSPFTAPPHHSFGLGDVIWEEVIVYLCVLTARGQGGKEKDVVPILQRMERDSFQSAQAFSQERHSIPAWLWRPDTILNPQLPLKQD